MRVWALVGQTPVVRVATNRDNTHFYGALNLLTGEEIVMRSAVMTGEVSVLFLQQILSAYPDAPILLLWDRATWHHGAEMRAFLASHPRLEIMWLPPGCPELNPQEHVWKAARESVSHNHGHTKLPMLAQEFERYLRETRFACSLLAQHDYVRICNMFKCMNRNTLN